MDVTCKRCGADVPAENAFCAECGAVMFEGAGRERREDPSSQLSTTISGAYAARDFAAAAESPAPADARSPAAHAPADAAHATTARRNASRAPEDARSHSTLFLVVGVAAVLALGGLLIYLIGLILRG